MFYIYVIKSLKDATRNIGSAANVQVRLVEHNRGKCRYTSGRMPWVLIYTEEYPARNLAMKREKFLKSGQGRKLLDVILSTAGGSSNGRTWAFEAQYLGSIPSPATIHRGN